MLRGDKYRSIKKIKKTETTIQKQDLSVFFFFSLSLLFLSHGADDGSLYEKKGIFVLCFFFFFHVGTTFRSVKRVHNFFFFIDMK